MIIKSLGLKFARFIGIGAKNTKPAGTAARVLQASSGAKNAVNGVRGKISTEELMAALNDLDRSNPYSVVNNFCTYM